MISYPEEVKENAMRRTTAKVCGIDINRADPDCPEFFGRAVYCHNPKALVPRGGCVPVLELGMPACRILLETNYHDLLFETHVWVRG